VLVEGIGSVELPVKRSPSSTGPRAHTTLHLSTVLHVPQAICNVLGQPLTHEYRLYTNSADPSATSIHDQQGRSLAYFREILGCKLPAIRLSGPPVGPKVGPSSLTAFGTSKVSIVAIWPQTEKEKWNSCLPSANIPGETKDGKMPLPSLATKSTTGPKKAHSRQQTNLQQGSASKTPLMSNSSRAAPTQGDQREETDKAVCASTEAVGENLIRVLSIGKETRSAFTFPSLHEAVRLAVSDEIPSVWFNTNEEDNDWDTDYDTHIMGKFRCSNKKCLSHGWSSKKIAIWIRGYANGGYNAVVFNQRCNSCDELGRMTLNKGPYVDRISYRLRIWAGLPVERRKFTEKKGPRHNCEHCEGCRLRHCECCAESSDASSSVWY